LLGQKTYSATINFALKEAIRMQKVQGLSNFLLRACGKATFPRCARIALQSEPNAGDRVSLILVDTSVWIELLNESAQDRLGEGDPERFVTCGPIVQEVLPGWRESRTTRQFAPYFEAVPCLADPMGPRLFVAAADTFRPERPIRSGVDCLIAVVAIEYGIPVWHHYRDFDCDCGIY
jgi:predicted nucleic acid-binding protein